MYSFSLLEFSWSGTYTQADPPDEPLPDELPPTSIRLHPVYPNPFNPAVVVKYELPESTAIDLRIYDIYGHLIRTLVRDRVEAAGVYDLTWDGRDDQGHLVAAGAYFCRLETPRQFETRRMMLMR